MGKVYKSYSHEYTLARVEKQDNFKKENIKSSQDSYEYIKRFWCTDVDIYESFFILGLNRANNTVAYMKISQGGIAGTVVDVKLVAKFAIESLCSAVIIAHNHPSGNLKPSEADKAITNRIEEGLKILDVQVLDHLIITNSSYFSFADEGLI